MRTSGRKLNDVFGRDRDVGAGDEADAGSRILSTARRRRRDPRERRRRLLRTPCRRHLDRHDARDDVATRLESVASRVASGSASLLATSDHARAVALTIHRSGRPDLRRPPLTWNVGHALTNGGRMLSIDLAADDIHDPRTRELFREVIATLGTECYRSCVVILWSVLVTDLVYKLQDLRDLHGDPTAKSILDELTETQRRNPTDSKWESRLLQEINDRLTLFGPGDYDQLLTLQKLRHLSAHPVLGSADILFVPTKESVRAYIRLVLESTLQKPPVFSKKITSEFVLDLASKKSLLPDLESLKRYIDARYARGLTKPVELELVRTLWKFCFKTSNPDTDSNRDINTRALAILFERRPGEYIEVLRANRDVFSDVSAGPPLDALIVFLGRFPAGFSSLTDAARVLIQSRCDESLDLFARALFLGESECSHVAKVAERMATELIGPKAYARYVKLAEQSNCASVALRAGAKEYCNSGSFDKADKAFVAFVDEHIPKYDIDDCEFLLAGIEQNGQAVLRGKARIDHPKIRARCLELLPSFDFSRFPRFEQSVTPT